jgi:chromosome segregation ATPase
VTFDQIEKNLQAIKEKEKIITLSANDREFSKDKKAQILEDIQYINNLLEQNKKKIATLNEQLKKSGGTIKGLQTKITELEAAMKQSEIEISDLKTALTEKNFRIEQLNTKVNDMQVAIEQKDQTINTQIAEMNKAYFTAGTFKTLKAKGLVYKEGGFLGIGKNKELKENFPDSLFSQIDITVTKTIPVNSKSAKLITEHPAGSYEMIHEDKDQIAYIEITKPNEFWKISKYAVVELGK